MDDSNRLRDRLDGQSGGLKTLPIFVRRSETNYHFPRAHRPKYARSSNWSKVTVGHCMARPDGQMPNLRALAGGSDGYRRATVYTALR